ncbi:hypothetical protein [Nisaea denitrificans]|uniref:hypothetical protein n=1 Tax=Nisaea denitrificans TaxID=390877 RepID=UPI00040FF9EF|nr:hypothetical protein [Nisaea denitrificans]
MSACISELANADAASSVPHAVFNVAETREKERYDLWQSSISCIFEVEAHRQEQRDDFQAEVDASMFGPLMLARTKSQNQKWSRSPALVGRDGVDHYMVQLYEQGRLNRGTRQGEFELPENSLLVFDLT